MINTQTIRETGSHVTNRGKGWSRTEAAVAKTGRRE